MRLWASVAGAVGGIVLAIPVLAESAFTLPYPAQIGSVPALAYKGDGTPLGPAQIGMESLAGGGVRIVTEAGRLHGAHMQATALLEPVVPGQSLRLTQQRTESFDPEGHSIGMLAIDHKAGIARCFDPQGRVESQLELPARDRIVNVPMNLFFLPLVRGDRDTLEFQVFLCRKGARVVDFEAWVDTKHSSSNRVEVRYGPDFGPLVSSFARHFVPRLAFWFEPTAPYSWQAHRLPLYNGGPEIIVIRKGVGVDALE